MCPLQIKFSVMAICSIQGFGQNAKKFRKIQDFGHSQNI